MNSLANPFPHSPLIFYSLSCAWHPSVIYTLDASVFEDKNEHCFYTQIVDLELLKSTLYITTNKKCCVTQMVQQVKVPVTKPEDLNSIPQMYMPGEDYSLLQTVL